MPQKLNRTTLELPRTWSADFLELRSLVRRFYDQDHLSQQQKSPILHEKVQNIVATVLVSRCSALSP